MLRRLTNLTLAIGLSLVGLPTFGDDKPLVNSLVTTGEGKLPIIISAPHGGEAAIPGVPERLGESLVHEPGGFVTVRDTGTEQLAAAVADAVEKKMGKRPFLVVAKFHRKFADANRPANLAYENSQAKPVYDAYHAALDGYCRKVQSEFGRGLLLDVHGQAVTSDTIYRGTQNGKTVSLLMQRFGAESGVGPKSFMGLLEKAGCKVYPHNDDKEKSNFTGGHIVATYGSHTGYGIDAIQLEFGSNYRTKDKIKDSAEKVAIAVEEFAKLYLPMEPKR